MPPSIPRGFQIGLASTEDARLAREALIHQALVQQAVLRDQLMRVFEAKDDHRKQSSENRMLDQYVANLMAAAKRTGSA
eukprot:jgi/Hompol1/336/HPOL_001129-RA